VLGAARRFWGRGRTARSGASGCPPTAPVPGDSCHACLRVDGLCGALQTVVVDQDGAASGTAARVCHCCGKPLPEGNLAWDYAEPDPLARLAQDERARRLVIQNSGVVIARGLGGFIRVILPVPVEHDREATFGVWLNVPDVQEWERVMEAGRQGGDSWAGVRFAGRLATAVRPWPQVFGSWAQALAPGPGLAARLVHSPDPLLAGVLTGVWPEETIRSVRGQHTPWEMTGDPTPNPYASSF
jgi:hypothetical protein